MQYIVEQRLQRVVILFVQYSGLLCKLPLIVYLTLFAQYT